MRTARRTGLVGLAVVALLLPGVGNAQARNWEAQASGSLGSVDVEIHGEQEELAPVAECETGVVEHATSSGAEVEGLVRFGSGSTSCTVDQDTGVATASVTGGRFQLDLRELGGPRIRMTSFSATCDTTETGSSARFRFSGLSGMTVPSSIPPNHVVTIPGPSGEPPLATVTVNEKIVPSPPDGSMTVNLMRFRLFPHDPSAEVSGDIVVGSASCDPF